MLLLEKVLELQQLLLELLLVEHVWGAPNGTSLRQNTGGRGRHRLRSWRVSARQPLSKRAAAAAHSFTEPIPSASSSFLPPGSSQAAACRGGFQTPPPTACSHPSLPGEPAPLPAVGPERAGSPLPSSPVALTAAPAALSPPRSQPPSSGLGQ